MQVRAFHTSKSAKRLASAYSPAHRVAMGSRFPDRLPITTVYRSTTSANYVMAHGARDFIYSVILYTAMGLFPSKM